MAARQQLAQQLDHARLDLAEVNLDRIQAAIEAVAEVGNPTILATFAVIFPAELPDKSFIATLVLATRYPRLWVWLGATLAFLASGIEGIKVRLTAKAATVEQLVREAKDGGFLAQP